jgi:hypothetical protein
MILRPSPNALLPAIALAALTSACGQTGGGGDQPSKPAASVLGNGDRISDVVGEADWLDPGDKKSLKCHQPADHQVHVTGVTVTAVDRFDETFSGSFGNMYVQDTTDAPGEYEGMTVFDPAFTPPDLRVAPGDVLDLFGVYQEFLGPSSVFGYCKSLPEIGGTGIFRFEGSDVPPKKLTIKDLSGYQNARRYLGMLVTLDNVKLADDPGSSNSALPTGGRYTAPIDHTGITGTGIDAGEFPFISNELYDILNDGPVLAKGTTFKRVTGVVTYFYGFKIAPRSPADFEP